MNKAWLLFLLFPITVSVAFADYPIALNIPPTNAFDKIHSDNGTISSLNYSMPLNINGGTGITITSSNHTHSIFVTSSAGTGASNYHRTGGVSWYGSDVYINSVANTQTLPSGNFTYAYPFIVGSGFKIDRIQYDIGGPTTGRCIVGIYNDSGSIYPSVLIATGTDHQFTTASNTLETDTISATLNSNTLYWMAYNCNGALTTMRTFGAGYVPTVLGWSGVEGTATVITAIRIALNNPSAGVSLTHNFGAGGSDQTNVNNLAVWVRAQ